MGSRIHEVMRGILLRIFMVIDLGLVTLALGSAAFWTTNTRQWTIGASVFTTKVSLAACLYFVLALVLAHTTLVLCNLYVSRRMSSKHAESLDVARAMAMLTVCLWCAARLFRIDAIPQHFFLIFWIASVVLISTTRLALRLAQGVLRRRGRNLHHVIVLGTNSRAVAFADRMQAMPERGCHILGFVDDEWSGTAHFRKAGFPLLCDYPGLAEFLRNNVVDEIAIYLPLRSFYERAAEIAQLAKHHGLLVRVDTDIFDLKLVHHGPATTDGAAHAAADGKGIDGGQLLLKRIFDFVASLALLVLLSPLFLIVAALIKLTSPGSVFFAQKRIGLNKRQFTMYKFRTMVPAAEKIQDQFAHLNEMTGPVFKIKNDPRITPIGRFLRKTSIDELPQLFNVLKGDMSLVGPRAIPLRDYQQFSEDWHRRRFSVPPGITCLWQVYGRNAIPFEQWMVLDMQYIDGWSLWLDIKILTLTIPAVFKGGY
jgi:exopolysaccharide biosynthesis polyprenyl glycosylphosphotransferase